MKTDNFFDATGTTGTEKQVPPSRALPHRAATAVTPADIQVTPDSPGSPDSPDSPVVPRSEAQTAVAASLMLRHIETNAPVIAKPGKATERLIDAIMRRITEAGVVSINFAFELLVRIGFAEDNAKSRAELTDLIGAHVFDHITHRDPRALGPHTDTLRCCISIWLERAAVRAAGQDDFALCLLQLDCSMLRGKTVTKSQYLIVYKALRKHLAKAGYWYEDLPKKRAAVKAAKLADAVVDAAESPAAAEEGVARKQLGVDTATGKHEAELQLARRYARELGQNGPISIDDVTTAMSRDYPTTAANGGRTPHMWKGGVFTTDLWTAISTVRSRFKSGNARPVQLWALKTWLEKNPLNGRSGVGSAYNLPAMLHEFKLAQPDLRLDHCVFIIGRDRLASDTYTSIMNAGKKLYGVPVKFVAGVGAMLVHCSIESMLTLVSE